MQKRQDEVTKAFLQISFNRKTINMLLDAIKGAYQEVLDIQADQARTFKWFRIKGKEDFLKIVDTYNDLTARPAFLKEQDMTADKMDEMVKRYETGNRRMLEIEQVSGVGIPTPA